MNFFEAEVKAFGDKKDKAILSFGEDKSKKVIIDGPRGGNFSTEQKWSEGDHGYSS